MFTAAKGAARGDSGYLQVDRNDAAPRAGFSACSRSAPDLTPSDCHITARTAQQGS